MNIKLNGQPHSLPAPMHVAALVESLGLNVTQIAIERNREIVPRSVWATTPLVEDDAVEIVRLIGGG